MNARVLLTGATGYIGGRLLRHFEEVGRPVRCLARNPERVHASRPTTEVVQGDCLDEASLDIALADVDSAYYLVHSMGARNDFAEVDRHAAANFGRAAARAGVRRIIYLGGLAHQTGALSSHLQSRAETGCVLRASGVPVIEFRASIVIGAGSLSFQMIEALVERLPVMVCPRWVATLTQPIAVDDVVAYLSAALDLSESEVVEIGGPDVVSYGDIMRAYAQLRGLRRWLLPVPLLTPHLSGLWLALVTPAQARVGRALVEGLRNPTVVRSPAARETFRITPIPLREACMRAIDEGAHNRHKIDARLRIVDAPPAQVFAPIRQIGGDTGWYFGDALWRLRGWLDTCLGGRGMPRHRRDPDACVVDDVIDGWHVEAYEPDRLLRLAAGLKLPGRGWLEFRVSGLGAGERSLIRQTATFDPRGLTGRLYWYAVLPLHTLLFRGLLRRIARRSVAGHQPPHRSTFTYCSVVDAPADEVFGWHEQPGALAALAPAAVVRIEEQEGGIGDGGRITLSVGLGPARVRWVMRHHGYMAGRRFCDEQVRGPFAVWRHTHRFEPIGLTQTLYEDRIEFVGGHGMRNRFAAALIRSVLTVAFAYRHRVVRARLGRAGRQAARRWVTAAIVVLAAAAAALPITVAAQTAAPRTVPFVDLDRYAGDWFEIARLPNRFQRQCDGDVRASYARRPNGRVDVVNQCRTHEGRIEARGIARIVDEQTFARLKVRFAPAWLEFLPIVWGDYWILGLAEDYSWAVVGSPDRQYLWILARTPRLDAERSAAARGVARANGFNVERLIETAHEGNQR